MITPPATVLNLTDANVAVGAAISRVKIAAVENVHLVAGAGEPAFQTGWVNVAGFSPTGFWYDPLSDLVHLQGHAQCTGVNPPANGVIFTLPTLYRPAATEIFNGNAHNGSAATHTTYGVGTNGDVTVALDLPQNGVVYLNGIFFRPADA